MRVLGDIDNVRSDGSRRNGMGWYADEDTSEQVIANVSLYIYVPLFDSIRFDFMDKCCTPISFLGRLFLTGMEIGGGRSEATTAHSVGSVPSPSGSLSLVRLV